MTVLTHLGGLLRAARREADMSQRQLARAAAVPLGTLARLEATTANPSLGIVTQLFAATGHAVLIVDEHGAVLTPYDGAPRDCRGRRYPAHLDVWDVDPDGSGWWGTYYPQHVPAGRSAPAYSFFLNRTYRDRIRDDARHPDNRDDDG